MKSNSFNYTSEHKKLFEISIVHDYFASNIFSGIEIIPNQETIQTLRNYELVVVKKQGGIVVLGKYSERFSGISFNEAIQLRFYFKILDSFFLNYTNIPFQIEKKYLFKNTQSLKDEILNTKDFVGESDLTELDFGNDINGLIEINLNENNEFFGEKEEATEQSPVQFIIKYTSRTVFTRYNLICPIDEEYLSEFYIQSPDETIDNIDFEERGLSNGKSVFSYLDKTEIKLSEHTQLSRTLKKKDNTLHTYTKRLPEPNLMNVHEDKNFNYFITDIFVNL